MLFDRFLLKKLLVPYIWKRQRRIFQRAIWIGQMFTLHVFDHSTRVAALTKTGTTVLPNPCL